MKLYWYKNTIRKYYKSKINLNTFSDYRLNRIKQIKNPFLRYEQIIAEALLQKVLIDNNYVAKLPLNIEKGLNNKPHIKGASFNYSNSHSNSFFGIVLSNKNVGMDVEHKRRFSKIIAKRWKINKKDEFIPKFSIYESLMKLLNDHVDFNLINFFENHIEYKNKTYYFKQLKRKSYFITILSDEIFDFEIFEIKNL